MDNCTSGLCPLPVFGTRTDKCGHEGVPLFRPRPLAVHCGVDVELGPRVWNGYPPEHWVPVPHGPVLPLVSLPRRLRVDRTALLDGKSSIPRRSRGEAFSRGDGDRSTGCMGRGDSLHAVAVHIGEHRPHHGDLDAMGRAWLDDVVRRPCCSSGRVALRRALRHRPRSRGWRQCHQCPPGRSRPGHMARLRRLDRRHLVEASDVGRGQDFRTWTTGQPLVDWWAVG